MLGWKIDNILVSINETRFTLKKANESIEITTSLIGRHNIGPIAAATLLSLELGVTKENILKKIASISPHPHRMQPYTLGGAWIIDDTYNGNIKGIIAGLSLLKELKAKRKIYVTPGLVEQGSLRESIHVEIGKEIANSNINLVILMQDLQPII